ncbi:MAG: nitroreductase [bacterium]|nr:nitroreductase [bacterium]
MLVSEVLKKRKAIRAFLPRPVEHEKIVRMLDAARHAPSGTNTQPWKVAVITGKTKQALCSAMESRFRSDIQGQMDYQYYPLKFEGAYKERRRACGLQMYSTLEIGRDDKQRQTDQWAANYRAFDAPAMLFFFIDRELEAGSFFDYGMFFQSLMLAAVEEGLATCPQAALAEYPDLAREMLGYSSDMHLVAGMALGYEEPEALVNSYRTPREAVDSFTRFFD